jgi:hypothetical protein
MDILGHVLGYPIMQLKRNSSEKNNSYRISLAERKKKRTVINILPSAYWFSY